MESVDPIAAALRKAGVRVYVDTRDQYKPGFKYAEHEAQGVPLRIAIGMRDIENGQAEIARRDTLQKSFEPLGEADGFASRIASLLETIQSELLNSAKSRMQSRTRPVDTYGDFKEQIEQGGFVLAHWDGTAETEARIKEETKATIRCVPIDGDLGEEMNTLLGLGGGAAETGRCMVTGRPSPRRVVLARAY
jgi:prolyl-tRNA synthetase